MAALLQDLRYAWRTLARSPGFAVLAILTLALGVGATTAMFSVVNSVLLQPLPYREPDRLASLWVHFGVGAQALPAMSPGDFRDYQQRSRTFAIFAAGTGGQVVGATGALTDSGSDPERVDVSAVTANFFPLLGVEPAYGRQFTTEEEAAGGPNVVILSDALWRRRYGGDPRIVGRRIRLDGIDQTVVGIMPANFHLWLPSEAFLLTDAPIWKPLQLRYANLPPRNFTFFTVFGRLAPGVTFEQAQAELDGIARQLRAEHQEHESGDMHVRVVPLQEDVIKHARGALLALFVAVAFVLVIACANVAHLLLARSTVREREMALRGALGATWLRLVRQLATESVVLALGGGLVGVFVAWVGTRAVTALNPANLPRVALVEINGTVVLFGLFATLLTAVSFGLLPALNAAGTDLNRVLRAGSGSIAPVRRRGALMITEMALALVLLIGAGLMIRSFDALERVRPGFAADGLLTFRLALPLVRYPRPDVRAAFWKNMETKLRAMPGVTDVGLISQLPLTGTGPLFPFAYDPITARNWESATSDGRNISPAYFRTMGTRLLAGRPFDDHDTGRQDVIIVDETLAARAWPGRNAVGERLQVQPTGTANAFAEVVGVVEHIRAHDLARPVRPQIYTPLGGGARLYVVVRTAGDPRSLIASLRSTMQTLDPDLPLDRVRPMSAYVQDVLAESRLNLILMSLFGCVALLLSSIGIYGVFSYSVGQRTREIGVRMALGQEPGDIRNLVLKEGAVLVAKSTLWGLAAAFVLARATSSLLYQVAPYDPATFTIAACVLMVSALAGCYVPARRATAVSPLVALRTD